jgi:transposase-like protein
MWREDKMTKKRKQYSPAFKFRVALEAAKEERTLSEMASRHGAHPNQVSQWKKQLLTAGAGVFSRRAGGVEEAHAAREAELYEQIGRLKIELEWLKKSCPLRLRPSGR